MINGVLYYACMLDYFKDEDLLTYKEVASILKIAPTTVAKYAQRKDFPLRVIWLNPEVKKEPRVKVSDLKDFLQSLEDPRRDI